MYHDLMLTFLNSIGLGQHTLKKSDEYQRILSISFTVFTRHVLHHFSLFSAISLTEDYIIGNFGRI